MSAVSSPDSMRSTRRTSSCVALASHSWYITACNPYLQSTGSLESKRWNLLSLSALQINRHHGLPALVEYFYNGKSVFLQRRIGGLVDGLMSSARCVVDSLGNVPYIVIHLLLFGRR